ncbi:S8 family serine peptidase [bacterium]|nr:S8 family serine peptidase [bacterium]PJA75096.1 MAG: hypothetical protein CO151_07570 [bacterium CG_4_9_14_3_um_filter_65_15]
MKFRAVFALAVTAILLLLAVGCSQDVTGPAEAPTSDDQSAVNTNTPEQNLAEVSKSAGEIVPDHFIVQFKGDVSDVPARARKLADKYGFELRMVYEHALKGFPVHASARVIESLRAETDILEIVPDRMYKVSAQYLPTGVDRIDTDLNPIANIDGVPTGVDVDIAIIDTGIDYNSTELNVVGGVKLTSGVPEPNFMDDNGHGTHVSGTAAAIDDSVGVVGVAPGARLWGVKVLNSFGFGSTSNIIAGIDWVTARAADIEIVNMSLSGVGWDSAFHTAVANCVNAGVIVVVAAGNDSRDVYGADGTLGTSDDVVPACFPEVATISAYGDSDGKAGGTGGITSDGADDSFASFSNFSASVYAGNPVTSPGLAIDMTLPGVDIVSTVPNGGYASASGTSMASPHAAGLFGLYIAQNGRPIDAAGVSAARQAVIDIAVAQGAPYGLAVANDPDGNLEPLGFAFPPQGGNNADIAITSFTGPAAVNPGDVLSLDVQVSNLGTDAAATPFDVYVYVQNNGFEMVRRTLPGLPAGTSRSGTVNFTVPAAAFSMAVPPGTYTIVCTHTYNDNNPGNDAASLDVELVGNPGTGTIVINPDPNALNAPWSLVGPDTTVTTGSGDTTIPNALPGPYTLNWGTVAGYDAPAGESLALTAGSTITFNGVYTVTPGSVTLNPDPNGLNAPWSLAGPNAYSSSGNGDLTISSLAPGDYTVTWGAVAGYVTPAGGTQTLAAGGSITFNGVYTPVPVGTIVINAEPNAINAPWTLDGPGGQQTGNGDVTLLGQLTGSYTITWGAVAGYDTPAGETLNLNSSQVITFAGTYVQQTSEAFGIWLDADATQSCAEAAFLSHVAAYIVYSDPSVPSVRGFEASLTLTRAGGATFNTSVSTTYPVSSIDVGLTNASAGIYNFITGYSVPVPTSTNTVMATLDFFMLELESVHVALGPSDPESPPITGQPAVVKEDFTLLDVGVGNGLMDLLSGGETCAKSASGASAFDGVRSLYR